MNALNPLALFDRIVPKDQGARRVVRDAAYGGHPRQKLDLYAPEDPSGRPLLVFFYGAAWRAGSRTHYSWAAQALAAQGFVVAIPDHRAVPEVHFPVFLEDAALAVGKAVELAAEAGGEPGRLLLAGHSSGAWLATMLALDASRLAVVGVDPHSVRGAAGLSGPYDFHPFDVPASVDAFGRAPEPLKTQPISFARPGAPPMWLATGDRDRIVQPKNSIALAARLRDVGGRAELRLYAGLGHAMPVLALSRPFRSRAPVLAEMTQFLANAAIAPHAAPRIERAAGLL